MTISSQKSLLLNSKSDLERRQLLNAIQFAQITAATKNKIVTLCPSADKHTCALSWRNDFIILSFNNVIQHFNHYQQTGELHWRSFPFNQAQLDYLPDGGLKAENASFWYCLPHETTPSWAIAISQSGRAREIISKQELEVFHC